MLTLKWPEREGEPRESGVPEDKTNVVQGGKSDYPCQLLLKRGEK